MTRITQFYKAIGPNRGCMIVLALALLTGGCSTTGARQGAGTGATIGAFSGAVGGLVTSLVFDGNIGEAATRAAVFGATSGAVVGGIAGAHQEAVRKRELSEKQTEELRENLGDDAFTGLIALTECKHDIALEYAKTAIKSRKKNESLAGIWIAILIHTDLDETDQTREMYLLLVSEDKRITNDADAEELTDKAYRQLQRLRADYRLPAACEQKQQPR